MYSYKASIIHHLQRLLAEKTEEYENSKNRPAFNSAIEQKEAEALTSQLSLDVSVLRSAIDFIGNSPEITGEIKNG